MRRRCIRAAAPITTCSRWPRPTASHPDAYRRSWSWSASNRWRASAPEGSHSGWASGLVSRWRCLAIPPHSSLTSRSTGSTPRAWCGCVGSRGALLDAKAVHPGRSAYHHLLALAQTNGIPPRRVPEVLELVGLEQVARQRAGGFSLGMGQRLGIAAALLGDPAVLLFDEPVNGLDPEGIRWIRELLKSLAAEGRTVFVSSHLMSEMALMAEHLVVIGRGRLIADASVDELVGGSSLNTVRVRTPQAEQFTWTLAANGARVDRAPDGTLTVSGLDPARIGDLAATDRITLHELSMKQASLEEAFMELTEDSVDFRASLLDTPMITANGATS